MNNPDASRRIASARELLRALSDSFPQALEEGRLPAWAKAAHSIVELLTDEDRPAVLPASEGVEKNRG